MDASTAVAIALACAGVALLLHHGWKHSREDPRTSHAQAESCACVCYFQPKDVSHFETWILVCLTNALSVGLGELLPPPDRSALVCCCSCALALAAALCSAGGLLILLSARLGWRLHSVSNHETWIVVCLTNAASLALLGPLLADAACCYPDGRTVEIGEYIRREPPASMA